VVSAIGPPFVRSDALAVHYQRRHLCAVNSVLYLAAFAVTAAVAQVLFFPEHPWTISVEIAAMVAVFVVWLSGRQRAWHEKWLRDRHLAERLRMALFTTLVQPSTHHRHRDDPLPFYRGPQQWLTHTVDALVRVASCATSPLPLEPLKQFVIQAWLADQQAFHAKNAIRKTHRAHRRHQLGFVLFGATLVMAVLHLLGVGHQIGEELPRWLRPGLWITFLALVLPVWAGAIHALTAQMELERVAERSRRMARALEWLSHRAARVQTPDTLAEVLHETAELMLVENHEWWVLLSFQDLRLHV
jgi:hypothetical protein